MLPLSEASVFRSFGLKYGGLKLWASPSASFSARTPLECGLFAAVAGRSGLRPPSLNVVVDQAEPRAPVAHQPTGAQSCLPQEIPLESLHDERDRFLGRVSKVILHRVRQEGRHHLVGWEVVELAFGGGADLAHQFVDSHPERGFRN